MKNILIVDDVEIFRIAIKGYLHSSENKSFEATNGFEAIEIIKNESIDLILCDVIMPLADGNEVYTFVKSNPLYANIPFVFLTAFLDSIFVSDSEVERITKPVTKAKILEISKKYL